MRENKNKKYFLFSFILGLVIFLLILAYDVITHKGIFIYFGDYNRQPTIFLYLMYDAVHNGGFPLWDWKTSMGMQFGGGYAFYNLFSPFTWITWIFPRDWLIYEEWILQAVKFGVASLAAFSYIRRYVRKDMSALIGGLLYAFSSFQMYNLVYHFHDALAFFPFLLLSFDYAIEGKHRGFFAFMVCFCAVLNYYFFFGEVIFLLIYFIVKCATKENVFSVKMFLNVAIQAVLGLGMSMVVLLPCLLLLMGNSKAGELISDNFFVYDNLWRYPKIIQSMFVVPDEFLYVNVFPDYSIGYPYGSLMSSVALYLPLFGMVGVIAFIGHNKKAWQSILIFVSAIFAFVPVLNASFSAFNSNYYARWYFMPILIMSMMSVYVFENSETISIKKGIVASLAVIATIVVFVVFYDINDSLQWTSALSDKVYTVFSIGIALVSLLLLYLLFYKVKRDKEFEGKALLITIVGIFLMGGYMFTYLSVSFTDKQLVIDTFNYNTENPLDLPEDEFYRTATVAAYENYSMMWKYNSISVFHSIYEPSTYEFYDFMGLYNDKMIGRVNIKDYYALASLTSTKYFYSDTDSLEGVGFEYIRSSGGYYIYENKAFIPMGFTYDRYISKEELSGIEAKKRADAMLKAICIDELPEGIELEKISADELTDFSHEMYLEDCRARAQESCRRFDESGRGFNAEITLSRDNLVFFSVPYNKGFTAYVDGNKSEIIKVNSGMCAVVVPQGTHSIEFRYFPVGMKAGIVLSAASLAFLAVYIICGRRKDGKR